MQVRETDMLWKFNEKYFVYDLLYVSLTIPKLMSGLGTSVKKYPN